MIATPNYNQVHEAYAISLARICAALDRAGVHVSWFTYSDSLITRGRNSIVSHFLNSDCEPLLIIDSDVAVDPNGVLALLECGLPFVGALVRPQ